MGLYHSCGRRLKIPASKFKAMLFFVVFGFPSYAPAQSTPQRPDDLNSPFYQRHGQGTFFAKHGSRSRNAAAYRAGTYPNPPTKASAYQIQSGINNLAQPAQQFLKTSNLGSRNGPYRVLGVGETQQWTKDFGISAGYGLNLQELDIDNDGIPEIYFQNYYEPASAFNFYDGATGNLKSQLTLTKPGADWNASLIYGWYSASDGDEFGKLYDVDGDGNKEFFVSLSSVSTTQVRSKAQLYDATTKALKWESSVVTLSLAGYMNGDVYWSASNIDSDAQKEIIYTTNKSTYNASYVYTAATTVTALQYAVAPPGSNIPAGSSAAIHTDLVDLNVPALTFTVTVDIGINVPIVLPAAASGQLASGVAVQITITPLVQPSKGVTISINYTLQDIVGMDASRLVIARYDDSAGKWIPLLSTVDAVAKTVTAITDHFSVFQIMQITPAADLAAITIGPNPYKPLRNPGQNVTFRGLPSDGKIKIYTYLGELIRELSSDSSGNAAWDGRNSGGERVASGVYVALVQGAGKKKIFKIMVEK